MHATRNDDLSRASVEQPNPRDRLGAGWRSWAHAASHGAEEEGRWRDLDFPSNSSSNGREKQPEAEPPPSGKVESLRTQVEGARAEMEEMRKRGPQEALVP